MKTLELPEFHGKPLIEIPKDIPQADFLKGAFGKAVLSEYQERVKADYDNNKSLRVLDWSENTVGGSNPLAVVLIKQIISQSGLRAATQADLEKILKTGALDLQGHYEDSSLVLRSGGGRNGYLTSDLAAQAAVRGYQFSPENPLVISLNDVDLIKDKDSNYGLTFKLKESAKPFNAPILSKDGSFNSDDIDESTGLPRKLGNGNRYSYTRSDGLSRLFLDWNLGLDSDIGSLSYSDSGGRVVVVSDVTKK